MVDREYVIGKIQSHINCSVCVVDDISDGAVKFKVSVVSEAFEGKSIIQRHRMIYEIFSEELKGPIHALSLTTLTPIQYSVSN